MSLSRRQLIKLAGISCVTYLYPPLAISNESMKGTKGLKDYFADDFLIGTALSAKDLASKDKKFKSIIRSEFNTLTLENEMKWERLHPKPGKWKWKNADRFIKYGEKNNAYLVGHVLVWHSQTPDWVFLNEKSKSLRSEDALLKEMENHISHVVDRFKGKVRAWDVVNEGFVDEGWRDSYWHKILGKKYMDRAFQIAHSIDGDAHLMYNDFNMHSPKKRAHVLEFLKHAKKNNVPVQGIGMQGHIGLDYPDINEFEASIKAFRNAGMRVHITELDVDVLPNAYNYRGADIAQTAQYKKELNPWPDGLPQKINDQLSRRYEEFFKLFLKYKDDIDRVTFWGTSDRDSWKNDFPVEGRTNYPLLFDRQLNKKDCYQAIVNLKR